MLEAYLGKSKDEILTWWSNNPDDPKFKYAWCAVFVSYMGYKCGYTPELPDGAIPSGSRSWTTNYEYFPIAGSVEELRYWGISHGRFTSGSGTGYTPKAGDIIIIDWDGNGNLVEANEHTGIVTGVDANGNIQYIDGNLSLIHI